MYFTLFSSTGFHTNQINLLSSTGFDTIEINLVFMHGILSVKVKVLHVLHHGKVGTPEFHLRPIKFHRTALERQIHEAVRIRRRGGEESLLNSKAEYNRCKITRLCLPEATATTTDLRLEPPEEKDTEWEQQMLEKA